MEENVDSNSAESSWVPYLLVLILFSLLFVANSYICDDAVISFRSIHNFANGYGLTFNPGERVQTFTGPLFTLCVTALYIAFRQLVPWGDLNLLYATTQLVSFMVSLITVAVVMKCARTSSAIIVTAAILFSSQAFMLNCSSGLETPMTLMLTALFFRRYLHDFGQESPRQMTLLFTFASLCVANRLDSALFLLPATLHVIVLGWRRYGTTAICSIILAALPLFTWLLFSLVYYGFLFPNSYYAKLGLSISADLRHLVGWRYLESTLRQDPITSIGIVAATAISLRLHRHLLPMVGALLFLYYVYDLGGDFIGYRFFAAPFLIAIMVLATCLQRLPQRYACVLGVCLIPILGVYNYRVPFSPFRTQFDESPNFDVQSYFRGSTILRVIKLGDFPAGAFHAVMSPTECKDMRSTSHQVFVGSGGLFTFCRGPFSHSIDPLSITDPLIARLPTPPQTEPFIPGHISKPVPRGYIKSLRDGRNELKDKTLRRYYAALRMIISDEIFSIPRFKAILRMNFTNQRRFQRTYLAMGTHPR